MDSYQITCINRPTRTSPHEHITHIGNLAGKWRMTREQAIAEVDAMRMAFYTVDRTTGKRMNVEVIRETGKLPYLRTRADGKLNDNLLGVWQRFVTKWAIWLQWRDAVCFRV